MLEAVDVAEMSWIWQWLSNIIDGSVPLSGSVLIYIFIEAQVCFPH